MITVRIWNGFGPNWNGFWPDILHQPSRGDKTTLVRFSSKVTCAEGSPFCLTLHIWKPAKANDSQSYNTESDFAVPHYDRRE